MLIKTDQEVILTIALVLRGPRNYADAEICPENFLFLPKVLLYAGWDHTHGIRRTPSFMCV